KEEWNTFFSGHWNFAGVKQNGHLAMFPEELPARLIKMFSFVGETVLDPFLGSGTTSLAARNLNRNSVGYEINPEFTPIIQDKLGVDQQNPAESEYIFLQDIQKFNLYNKISELPYVFADPLKLDKKIDPKKIQFGSKIDKDSIKPIDYFSVKEIISPSLIRLDNDLIIRLLGIKENNLRSKDAIEYLKKNFLGQKVFLKFDNQKYDENNNLLCYLYLKNKTFINAYLLKEGLTDVDTSLEYRFKNRFLEYGELKNG
ncbi:MAG: DNA methyltransferase, partial [Anaerolineaceae bacterium]